MCSKAISEQERYDELACYTLAHPDPGFIHQNIVDAFGAQTATEADKPIKIAFALVGLYLSVVQDEQGARCSRRTCVWQNIGTSGRVSDRLRIAAPFEFVM